MLSLVVSCGKTARAPDPAVAHEDGGAGTDAPSGSSPGGVAQGGPAVGGRADGGGHGGHSEESAGEASTAGAAGETAGAAGEGGAVDPGDGPVHGHVLFDREPVVGIQVVLDRAATTTGADGSFVFAAAPATYRLAIINAPSHMALVLDGMHGREPLVQFDYSLQNRSAKIHGTLAGSTGTAAQFLQVGFVSQTHGAIGRSIMPGGGNAYDLEAYWNGAETQSGQLWALAYETNTGDVDDLPKSYLGFARAALSLSEGDDVGFPDGSPATNLTLSRLQGQDDLLGTVQVPSGYVVDGRSGLDVGPFTLPLDISGKSGGPYSSVVPRDAELPIAVHFSASLSEGGEYASTLMAHAIPASGPLNLELPAAPRPVSPANGAQGVTAATPFTWTAAPPGLVARARFGIGSWYIWRMTSGASTTIPDLSAYGVPFPKGETGSYSVQAFGPATNVDEAASLVYGDLGLSGTEYVATFAGDHTFTMAK